MGRARPRRWPFGVTRRSQERVTVQLDELRRLPLGGGPDGDFREHLRHRLTSAIAEPEERAAPARTARHARRHPTARVSWASQLATFALAAGMMLAAFLTYQSVPGDTLYPLKRAAESTLVRLSKDDVERAERELVSAKERASEVAALLGSSGDHTLVAATLSDMEKQTRSAISRLQRVEPRSPKLNSFAQSQRDAVKPMLDQLVGPQADQANTYLLYIEGLAMPG